MQLITCIFVLVWFWVIKQPLSLSLTALCILGRKFLSYSEQSQGVLKYIAMLYHQGKKKKCNYPPSSRTWLIFFFFFFFFFLRATLETYGSSLGQGSNWNYSCWPMTQPKQWSDLSCKCDLCGSCGCARSLTHSASKARIEPASSWILVGLLTCWDTMELLV